MCVKVENNKTMGGKQGNMVSLLYALFVGPFSILLFLYGFFPVKDYDNTIANRNNIPQFIENVRTKTDTLYEPIAERIIIMVIDALRWDFVAGPIGQIGMPVTSSLIANSSACLFQAKVQTPTVTMPRIKAMTTGTVPNFVDIALNLGSKPIVGDSVLRQAKNHGHKLVFYGDDTWLNLFPTLFDRYNGTTSFFVTDFTEVDNNVTRHIHKELHNNDWSVMILHYLGLDHIGHVAGPFHPLIKTKLKEMDDIISQIHSKILHWNENQKPSIFIICGDHGMKDSGGHGGATKQETSVPFVITGRTCSKRKDHQIEIAQLDIAATLSVILGIPIPFLSLGTVILDVLHHLPVSKKLFILYYNSQQILHHFRKVEDYQSHYSYKKYLDAVKLHVAWLNTNGQPNDMVDNIIQTYETALKGMKNILISRIDKYNICIMTAAIFLFFQVLRIVICREQVLSLKFKNFIRFILINFILWLMINYFCDPESTIIFLINNNHILLKLTVITLSIINSYFITSAVNTSYIFKIAHNKTLHWMFSIGTTLHAISYIGTSFVEEEHQTWYFFWITLLVILLYNSSTELAYHWPYCSKIKHCWYIGICIKLLLLSIAHRILRKLNSTGDKFAHLPDISGWLKEQEHVICMTLLVLTALGILIWIGFICEDLQYKKVSVIFYVACAICIYLRHMANKATIQIPFYPSSRGIYEVVIFRILLIIFYGHCIKRILSMVAYNKTEILSQMLLFIIQIWIMISAMLHQPYNIILLPMQIISISTIAAILKNNKNQEINIFVHSWAGNVFYFYQGNSNSLATIDVAAGYVGLQSYEPTITGILLIINTYSAPILSYFMYIYYETKKQPNQLYPILSSIRMYLFWRLLPTAIYTVIVYIQRHHLFVWSVFSPKLLYEAVHSSVICFTIFFTLILMSIQNFVNQFVNVMSVL